MSAQHIIELNGKRYDTVTGKLIDSPMVKKSVSAVPSVARPTTFSKAINIDGIRRLPKSPIKPNNITRRQPQRSQTLMRTAAHAATRTQPPIIDKPVSTVTPGLPRTAIDTKRLKRAQTVSQNQFIGHFSATNSLPTRVTETMSEAPMAAPPVTPVIHNRSASAVRAAPVMASTIEQALSQANSHEQLKSPKARRHRLSKKLHVKPRTLKTLSIVAGVFLLGGLATYQNFPKVQMKLASSRSGVSGALPANVPSGFNLNKDIAYKPGEITLDFQSNSDQRSFNVTQSQSFWTSETLRQNYLEPLGVTYQTVQENGKTIYLYGNKATWVDGGVWYKVDGSGADLSNSQLSNLVDGL